MDIPINEIRPGVLKAAQYMERVLRANDHKGGWGASTNHYLINRIFDDTDEIANIWLDTQYLVDSGEDFKVNNEMALKIIDVMNLCMMILDNREADIEIKP